MNVIIGNSWPYANGPLHLGRIVVLLPGDVLARYHRLMGDNVVFISGSDSHGDLIVSKAKEENLTPLEIAEKYHEEFVRCFKKLNFSFDVFTKTHTEYHIKKVKEFLFQIKEKGYIYEENNQLIFALSKFEKDVQKLFIKEQGWRENAINITKRYLDGGLRDRALTKDTTWGIDIPFENYEDKKVFVWIEALMGYLTASIKYIEEKGEDYLDYWDGEDSRVYLVHGKDNIPFHTVMFPSILKGIGIKNTNIREISSEYLKLEGKQFSTVKNWALWVDDLGARYNIDALRYYLILNGPENRVTDFTWKGFININNNDLVLVYNEFINEVITFIHKNFKGEIPKGEMPKKLQNEILNLYFNVGDMIEEGEFKKGLQDIMKMIKKYNTFFNREKPWESIYSDLDKCKNTIYICIQVIINTSNLMEPFMPETAIKIRNMFGLNEGTWSYIEKKNGQVSEFKNLFEFIDRKNIIEEIKNLKDKTV